MIYYILYEFFGIHFFVYISVRAVIGFFLGFFLTLYFMRKLINAAKVNNTSQPIYEHAPKSHQDKKQTPTMGGLAFMLSILVASVISGDLSNIYLLIGFLVIIAFTALGALDDFSKIFKGKNELGLSAKKKFLLQVVLSFTIASFLYFFANFPTELFIPFYKYPLFDMGIFAIGFWTLVLIAGSNAVNLTDGLDGLATVPSIFGFASLAFIMYITGHALLSEALLLPKIIGVGEVTVLAISAMGGLLGFLWFNANPAEIFMGDSGSLSIGALFAYMGILSKSEFLLFLIGFIFVIETCSVMLQVASFKFRNKRIFLMAPLHHHYELKGLSENKIIVRFWIVALLSNILALISLKVR